MWEHGYGGDRHIDARGDRRTFRPIMLAVCAKALEPEVSGTSLPTFNTVTFHRGGVKVSDALRAIRSEALSLLETL